MPISLRFLVAIKNLYKIRARIFASRRISKRYAVPNPFQPHSFFAFHSLRYCAANSKSAPAHQRTNTLNALFLGCATYTIPIRDVGAQSKSAVRSFCIALFRNAWTKLLTHGLLSRQPLPTWFVSARQRPVPYPRDGIQAISCRAPFSMVVE